MTPDLDRPMRRWLALGLLCAGMLMIVLDQTIVNVALPSIQADLGFSQSMLAWVINAYLIAFGGLLLLAGRLGDLIGRKRVFLGGLAAFTLASLLCGVSGSQAMLIATRFIQGIGGATTSAVILGMIVTMFSEPRERAKALGVYGFVASAGASIGLLMGGLLTQALNWHWIFFVNVPIGLLVMFLTARLVPPDTGLGWRKGADVMGSILITASLMLGVYAIVQADEHGLGSSRTIGLGGLAIALLAAFLVRQATTANPLMPLTIFRSRSLSGANLIQALSVAAMIGMFFLSSLYLERVLDYAPLELGLAFLPTSLIIGVLSLAVAPRLSVRFGPRQVLFAGLFAGFLGLGLLTRAPASGTYLVDVLPAMLLIGLGVGIMFPVLMAVAMAEVAPAETGLASGLVNTTGQVGGALGLAILATAATARTDGLLAAGASLPAALTAGYDLAFGIGACLFAAALAVTVTVLAPATSTDEPCGEPCQATAEAAG